MKHMKLYLTALKKLPNKFLHDDTRIAQLPNGIILASHPWLPAMIFSQGEWKPFDFRKPHGY